MIAHKLSMGEHEDQRGKLSFFNQIESIIQLKRIYIVEHFDFVIRGWHGHKTENRFAFGLEGEMSLSIIDMNFSREEKPLTFVLKSNDVVFIPKGHAVLVKNLTKYGKMMFVTDKTIDEIKNDDYRFKEDHWSI